jgi:hypothetical protein
MCESSADRPLTQTRGANAELYSYLGPFYLLRGRSTQPRAATAAAAAAEQQQQQQQQQRQQQQQQQQHQHQQQQQQQPPPPPPPSPPLPPPPPPLPRAAGLALLSSGPTFILLSLSFRPDSLLFGSSRATGETWPRTCLFSNIRLFGSRATSPR